MKLLSHWFLFYIIYFLAVIKYKKSDDYIRQKIEPYLHTFSISMTSLPPVIFYFLDLYNIFGSVTYTDYAAAACISQESYLPHCIGYANGEIRYEDGFTMPCSRRGDDRFVIFIAGLFFATIIPPIVIGTSFTLIYRKVVNSGKKLTKYGVGSLKLDLKPPQSSSDQLNCFDQDQKIEKSRICAALFRKLLNPQVS